MPGFSVQATYLEPVDLAVSRFTDLEIGASGDVLYATNHYDGGLTAWQITAGNLLRFDSSNHASDLQSGASPNVAIFDQYIFSGGGTDGELTHRAILPDGSFAPVANLGSGTIFQGDLLGLEIVELASGGYVIYAGIANSDGLAKLRFNNVDTLIQATVLSGSNLPTGERVKALTTGTVSGNDMLFTTSANHNGVTAWAIDANGDLTEVSTLGSTNGFWVDNPTAIEFVRAGSKNFVLVASANSSSISVLEVTSGGTLTVVDHIIDDRFSRFANIQEMTVVSAGDMDFVLVSGADDGISAYAITGDGKLVHRGTIEDTNAIGLENIDAIAAQATSDGLEIYVASSVSAGLTHLKLTTGTMGDRLNASAVGGALNGTLHADLLTGSNAADLILGGDGNDILIDGAGTDFLSGGSGADVFVLNYDDAVDTISDFTLGEDKIDLSNWPMLGSLSQLTWTRTNKGITITYGADTLVIETANATSLTLDLFQETDLLGPDRIAATSETGFPGPPTDDPDLPNRIIYIPPTQAPAPEEGGQEVVGTSANETLFGGVLGDSIYGASNADVLHGLAGSDILNGGTGGDTIFGGSGDDTLYGGAGRDANWTSATSIIGTSDELFGGDGNDILFGQSGADKLDGGAGNDLLHGGGGRDSFIFNAGRDKILDFTPFVDRITFDTAALGVNATADQILSLYFDVNAGVAEFDFGAGNVLQIIGVSGVEDFTGSIDIA